MSSLCSVARLFASILIVGLSLTLASTPVAAQTLLLDSDQIDAVGGNSSNSRMFWLNFDPEDPGINETVQLNTEEDATRYPSLNSFTFFQNTCGENRSDIIAASTNASRIVLYREGKGDGEDICSGSGCPTRPVGLSTSEDGLISVAQSGAASSRPAVFVFTPECSEADAAAGKSSFSRKGGDLTVNGVRIRGIADTAFVLEDRGGLETGQLLVLLSNPAKIVVANVGSGGATGDVLVDSSYFGRATPTGLAVVPGTGDVAHLLVTLSTGKVLNLWRAEAPGWSSRELSGTRNLFPNPRGIAAGTRDNVPYIIVAEQNQGRYVRVELDTSEPDDLKVSSEGLPIRTIFSPVGAPQGVAIKPEDASIPVVENECWDVDPGTNEREGDTGCDILGAIQVHLSTYGVGQSPGDSISAKLQLVKDDRDGPDDLPLPGFDGFSVPQWCRGFDTGSGKYLVVLDMGLNFSIPPANFIKVTEQAASLLDLDRPECTDTSARIYFRPGDSPGPLSDRTFYCGNPSRSILESFSPVVLCFDPLHRARKDKLAVGLQPAIELDRDLVNDEIRRRIDVLKDIVEELKAIDDPEFFDLGQEINSRITGRTNPQSSQPQERYLEGACELDHAALAVFKAKTELFADKAAVAGDDTLYARAVSETLGLAFYFSEVGALTQYHPPEPFCEVGPGDPGPELPDVTCGPLPPTDCRTVQ